MTESRLGDLEIQYVAIEEIDPHPENANIGNVEVIKESIQVNGYYAPIIVQSSTGFIIAGNHRYIAAKELNYTTIPVVYVDVTDEEAKRMMVADNRSTRLGHDDDERLAALLSEIGESDQGLLGTGFTHAELQTLQDALEKFDEGLENEPDPEAFATVSEEWVLEPLEDGQGGCSSVLVHRFDKKAVSAADFNRIRMALGLGAAPRGALATFGIEDWA